MSTKIQNGATRLRQIASNEVLMPSGHCLTQHVVCLSPQGWVTNVFPLRAEQAFTEWFPGRLTLESDAHGHQWVIYKGQKIT